MGRSGKYAYERLSNTRISLDKTGNDMLNNRYRHDDIISCNDWDNNGLIDVFDHPRYAYCLGGRIAF